METIKVNMSPNPLDVQTIHASQNDGEARQWEFELHNNGEVIDAGGITDQIVFKAYEGGTEELLPSGLLNGSVDLGSLTWEYQSEYSRFRASFTGFKPSASQYVSGNILCAKYTTGSMQDTQTVNNTIAIGASGINYVYIKDTSYADATTFKESLQGVYLWYETTDSTPTTSPFKGDIKYPQGLLSDQEFLYRESPTEEDGLAKITDIKGNTLVWNQLVKSDVATSTVNGVTFTNNNDNTWTLSGTATATAQKALIRTVDLITAVSGHKYLVKGGLPNGGSTKWLLQLYKNSGNTLVATDNGKGAIYTADSTTTNLSLYFTVYNGNTVSGKIYPQIFDLTKMGLDSITDPSDFTSLFPLPYYSYNQGTLLSFNGDGIKTVGKNLVYKILEKVNIGSNGQLVTDGQELYDLAVAYVVVGNKYIISPHAPIQIMGYFTTDPVVGSRTYNNSRITDGADIFTAEITGYVAFRLERTKYEYAQLEIGVTRTSYVEYDSNTTPLPASDYYPTGLKSAGGVYDELTPRKAITRIGAVDLGTLTYSYTQLSLRFEAQMPSNYKIPTSVSDRENMICAKYSANPNPLLGNGQEGITGYQNSNKVFISDDQSIIDPAVFKTMMNGVILYYELATPTETSFTTASLVTENAEIPLSNEDGVLIGKCTEELSAEPGFHDAKIKLTDADGECYSNKLQLHVERSPQ